LQLSNPLVLLSQDVLHPLRLAVRLVETSVRKR
jgi:hypothetical protein